MGITLNLTPSVLLAIEVCGVVCWHLAATAYSASLCVLSLIALLCAVISEKYIPELQSSSQESSSMTTVLLQNAAADTEGWGYRLLEVSSLF